jgi:hypothetical protein
MMGVQNSPSSFQKGTGSCVVQPTAPATAVKPGMSAGAMAPVAATDCIWSSTVTRPAPAPLPTPLETADTALGAALTAAVVVDTVEPAEAAAATVDSTDGTRATAVVAATTAVVAVLAATPTPAAISAGRNLSAISSDLLPGGAVAGGGLLLPTKDRVLVGPGGSCTPGGSHCLGGGGVALLRRMPGGVAGMGGSVLLAPRGPGGGLSVLLLLPLIVSLGTMPGPGGRRPAGTPGEGEGDGESDGGGDGDGDGEGDFPGARGGVEARGGHGGLTRLGGGLLMGLLRDAPGGCGGGLGGAVGSGTGRRAEVYIIHTLYRWYAMGSQ